MSQTYRILVETESCSDKKSDLTLTTASLAILYLKEEGVLMLTSKPF